MLSATSDSTESPNWFFSFALALSAVLMSVTLTVSNGFLTREPRDFVSLLLLTLSLLSCLAAIVFHDAKLPALRDVPLLRLLGKSPANAVLVSGCIVQIRVLITRYGTDSTIFLVVVLLSAAVALAWYLSSPIVERRFTMKQAIPGFATLGCFVLCASLILLIPLHGITDVAIFQSDSSRALAAGANPYALTFPNIYGDDSKLYGPGISVNGRVQFGFPYFPISLLWVMPAQLLLGNFRYGHLLAVALAAFFIAALRPTRTAAAAAMLLAFSVPTFYVLQTGWTEPVVAMLFCFNIWLLSRQARTASAGNRASGVALGLFLATKQYLVFVLPLIFLLPLRDASTRADARWKTLCVALGVAALTVLPFVLWNLRAFWWSVFELQFHQPFRDDALSYLAAFKEASGVQLSSAICFLMATGAVWLCWKRAPRTVAGFAASVALVHFVFFAFNKQAFCNYYFFVFAALCCAAAAAHCEQNAA